MIRADLHFNHYFPFYTLECSGRKKYCYIKKINVHLSDTRRFFFKLQYNNGKLSQIEFKHNKGERFNLYDKGLKYISYVDFALNMKSFENFLLRGIKALKTEPPYRKIMVFGSNYKFNENLELDFSFGEIIFRKGEFDHVIEGGKLVKPKRDYGEGDLGKVGKFLDAFDSNYKFNSITEDEFNKDLENVMHRYIDYLAPPKMLRKKEYQL